MTEFLDLFIQGLVLGSVTGALAVSFALIIGVTGRFHIAYITTFALCAYAAIYCNTQLGFPVGVSALVGLALAVLVGMGIEAFIYRPIANHAASRGANPLIPTFISSLGLSTLATNLISVHFNTTPTPFNLITETRIKWGALVFPNTFLYEVVIAWAMILGLYYYLRYTQRGKWISAVRSNIDLASTVGINTGRIFLLVFAIGSFFSGVLGLMYTDAGFASPSMGFDQVFEGFLIAFLAGMNSSPVRMGIVGLIIGEITDLTQFWVSPAYSTVIVFGILMLYVVYKSVVFRRPQYAINFRALRPRAAALKEA
jgi:branched-chain amino acid transport system permease protein